jgi:ribosomal protein S18 acetylase RimI-like enzyme
MIDPVKIAVTTELQKIIDSGARMLEWDTEFWGVKVAETGHPDVDEWALEHTVGCVQMLLDSDEVDRLREAEDRGFRVMDVRVELRRPTAKFSGNGLYGADPEDVDPLVEIAREAHRITRFYADPKFPDERCDDLYEAWIRNSLDGWATETLIPADKSGYVTVHVAGRVASIGLIAVDARRRRIGLGSTLCHGAIGFAHAIGATDMTVVTQARNTPALRLFSRCGFQIRRTSYWLHKWYT